MTKEMRQHAARAERARRAGVPCATLRTMLSTTVAFAVMSASCAQQPLAPVEVEDRSLGEEVYLVLCEHLAGSEFPTDPRGTVAWRSCNLDLPAPAEGVRTESLRQLRPRLVGALDAVLEDVSVRDELSLFVQNLLPLWDPPEPMPEATRGMAEFFQAVIGDPEALAALQRVSGRRGYRPLKHAMGSLAAVSRYPGLQKFLSSFAGALVEGGSAHASWQELTLGLGLELASYERAPEGEMPALEVLRDLLLEPTSTSIPADEVAPDPLVDPVRAAWLVQRDARGFARPGPALEALGSEVMVDGRLPVDGMGRFLDAQGNALDVPTPFAVIGPDASSRDAAGRAVNEDGLPYYAYFDVGDTVLGSLATELQGWFTPDASGRAAVIDFSGGLETLMGAPTDAAQSFGALQHSFPGHDTSVSPLMSVMDFTAPLLEAPEFDGALVLFDRLLTDHEPVVARFAQAMLAAKARSDGYVDAHIAHPSNFWDDMTWLIERMTKRSAVDGENQLEALMRAMADERIKHLGPLVSLMARYKDAIDVDSSEGGANINGPVIGQYGTPVDRSLADRPGNRSQLQGFVHLVGELMDRPLCNKATTLYGLMTALGIDVPLGSLLLGTPIEECGFIKAPDMGRVFGQAMTGEADLLQYMNSELLAQLMAVVAPPGGDGLGVRAMLDGLFEDSSGVDGFTTTPDGKALVRILFAPPGTKTSDFANQLFYPLTARPYIARPDADPNLDWSAICPPPQDADDPDCPGRSDPPAHLRLDQVYAGVMAAWEIDYQFDDGASASMLTSIGPMLEAFNRHDWVVSEDPERFDTERYMFNPMVGTIANNYASINSGMGTDPTEPFFSHMSNLVSYEAFLGDMLGASIADSPSHVDPADGQSKKYLDDAERARYNAMPNVDLMGVMWSFLHTLDEMDMGDGQDGIDVMAGLVTRLANPHLHCDPDSEGIENLEGKGACDSAPTRTPLRFRDNGDDHLTYELGEVHDRSSDDWRQVSPLQQLLRGLSRMDEVLDAKPEVREAWRSARSKMIDQLFESDGQRFQNPRTVPLLRASLGWARTQLARHSAGGPVAMRAWATSLPGRFETFVQSPVVTALVHLLADAQADPELHRELASMLSHAFGPGSGGVEGGYQPMLLSLADVLQLLEDEDNMVPLMRVASEAFVSEARVSIAAGQLPAEHRSTAEKLFAFVEAAAAADPQGTLSKVMGRMVDDSITHEDGAVAPLETLLDVLSEVHRAEPGSGQLMDSEDIAITLHEVAHFLTDERRGMERMYSIIQNRSVGSSPASDEEVVVVPALPVDAMMGEN